MRKRSWARIPSAIRIKGVVILVMMNLTCILPAAMAFGNGSNPISLQVDWPLNDSMNISDSMTSSFSSFGHYLGPLYPQPSGWSDGHSNILWAGNIRLYVRDNPKGNQDSPPSANNFRNRHPLHIMVTCQNAKCTHFNKEEGKNIIKYGKSRNGWQRYKCQHCKKIFTETYETFLHDRKLIELDMNQICGLLVKKHSFRSIEKITGHHRDTIRGFSMAIKQNPESSGRILFSSMNITKAEMNEMMKTINHNCGKNLLDPNLNKNRRIPLKEV